MTKEVPDKQGRVGAAKGGRPVNSKSARSLRQTKIKQVLDQIDPLLRKALLKAEQILDADLGSKDVTSTTQLGAAKLIIEKSIELREIVFSKEKDQLEDPKEDEDEEPRGAVLSFSIVDQKK